MRYIFALIGLIICTEGAWAHSKINKTMPADGAILKQSPQDIAFHFDKTIRITRIVLSHESSNAVGLDYLDGYEDYNNRFKLPIVSMGNGAYQVQWRGISQDGHVMQGDLRFAVE